MNGEGILACRRIAYLATTDGSNNTRKESLNWRLLYFLVDQWISSEQLGVPPAVRGILRCGGVWPQTATDRTELPAAKRSFGPCGGLSLASSHSRLARAPSEKLGSTNVTVC